MTDLSFPKTTRIRQYNVTGNIVLNTLRDTATERLPSDFFITVADVSNDQTTHFLVISLGTIDVHQYNDPPKLVLEEQHAETIYTAIRHRTEKTLTCNGELYQAATPFPEQFTTNIMLTSTPITTAQTSTPGLILTAGETDDSGARIEFSPEQIHDFKVVLSKFIDGTLTDPDTGLAPHHIDERGIKHAFAP